MNNKSRYRFVIFANVILVRSCVGLIWASAGPLLPLIIQEFELSRSTASWFASIAPLTIAVISLPVNIVVGRFGLKKMFAVGAFFQAMGILSFFADSFIAILLLRMCFAVGNCIIIPVATAITAEWFSSRELPILNGIGMSFVNLGNGVAFAITVPLALWLSWNAPVYIYGAVALVWAICWCIIGKEKKKEPELVSPDPSAFVDRRPDLGLKKILTNKTALLLTLSVTVSWAMGNAIGSWLPDYYFSVFGIPLSQASSIMTFSTVGGTISCITGGILSTRLGKRRPFIIISGLFTGLSALFAVLFNIPALIYVAVTLFGVFGAIHVSSLFTIPMEIPEMSMRSGMIVIAMMQVGGNLGNFISPLVTGAIVDATGSYLTAFITFIVLSLGLLAAGILMPETGPAGSKPDKPSVTASI